MVLHCPFLPSFPPSLFSVTLNSCLIWWIFWLSCWWGSVDGREGCSSPWLIRGAEPYGAVAISKSLFQHKRFSRPWSWPENLPHLMGSRKDDFTIDKVMGQAGIRPTVDRSHQVRRDNWVRLWYSAKMYVANKYSYCQSGIDIVFC